MFLSILTTTDRVYNRYELSIFSRMHGIQTFPISLNAILDDFTVFTIYVDTKYQLNNVNILKIKVCFLVHECNYMNLIYRVGPVLK